MVSPNAFQFQSVRFMDNLPHVPCSFVFEILGLSHAVNMSQYAESTLESLICRASNRRAVFFFFIFLIHISSSPSHLEVDLLPWHHASSHSGLSVTPIEMDYTGTIFPWQFWGTPYFQTYLEIISFATYPRDICVASPYFATGSPKNVMYPTIPNELTKLFCNHPIFPIIIPPPSPSPSPSTKQKDIIIYIYIRLYIIIIPLLVAWHIIFIHVSCLILEVIFCHHAPNIPPTQCAINIIKGKNMLEWEQSSPLLVAISDISDISHAERYSFW